MRNLMSGRVLYGVFLRVVLLLLTAAGARQSLQAETPEMYWQEVYPYPTASWLNAAAWGPPGFVAVGSDGEILGSADGLQWQKSTNGVPKGVWFSDVCFYNGRYVALGDSGALLWSTNGLNWQQVSTGTNTWLRACAGGGGQYVIAAGNNTLLVSTNAMDWQPRAVPENFCDIVCGSNQWVAVTGGSGIFLSTDLLNWTNTNPSFIPYSGPCFGSVSFGEGKFVVGGAWQPDQLNSLYGTVIYFSSNGVTWTAAALSGLNAFGEVKSSVFAAGQFVAVQARYFLRSTNGENWEKIPTIDAGGALRSITSSSAGRFLAVGEKGAMLRSDDGQTWTVISVNPRDDIHDVAYADGRFCRRGWKSFLHWRSRRFCCGVDVHQRL